MGIDIDIALARARHDTDSGRHQAVLRWYQDHAGTTLRWPRNLAYEAEDGSTGELLLVSRRQGIRKPKWCDYALSVRAVTVRHPMEEHYPEGPDGMVEYRYRQQGEGKADRDKLSGNRGLMKCLEDQIPVGVLRKVQEKPLLYEILGLMFVIEWRDGWFLLRSHTGASTPVPDTPFSALPTLEAVGDEDMREWAHRRVAARRGQAEFRSALLKAYEGQCAITGCDVEATLEAAHISPYRGNHTNRVTNGLLLRADVHTLFDLGMLMVRPRDMTVQIAEDLQGTEYGYLEGRRVHTPCDVALCPDVDALERRYAIAR